jgi:putative ABC transport system permease protein
VGLRLFGLGTRLLPKGLQERFRDELGSAFADRQREALERWGVPGAVFAWAREWVGLLSAGIRARRPDAWTRRTVRTQPGAAARNCDAFHPMLTLETAMQDLRFALRTFMRRPALTLLAGVTLSLGIGASTAVFSVVHSVLLRSLPYPEPEELVSVYPTWPNLRGHPTLDILSERGSWSWPEFFAVQENQTSFNSISAFQSISLTLTGDGRPERVRAGETTYELFTTLGVAPLLGRLLTPEDDPRAGVYSVVLTAEYWQDRFAGDTDIVGRTLYLNDRPYQVVGILPEGFGVTNVDVRLWTARAGSSTDTGHGNHMGIHVIARLATGVTIPQAREEVIRLLEEELPPEHAFHEANVFPCQADVTHRVRPVLMSLLVASILLLVVACGNVAALLIGAGIDRERELAVRSAMGASRTRIVQQLLMESTVLATIGTVGGIVMAAVIMDALVLLAPSGLPRLDAVSLNGTVLAFSIALSLAAGIGFGSIPAFSLSSFNLARSFGARGTSLAGRLRLQSAVVVGELTLATLLLVSGALLARTVSALNQVDPGFTADGVLAVTVATPYQRFDTGDDDADRGSLDSYFQRIIDEVEALPGVQSVATTYIIPLSGDRGNNNVTPEGWNDPDTEPIAERRFVSTNYFETLGMDLVAGRPFEATDDDMNAPSVVIVSEGLAELAWPGEDAIGKRLDYWEHQATVVGVASNVRDETLEGPTELAFYAPVRQNGAIQGSLLIRTNGDAGALVPAVRERVWSVDPDLPITRTVTMGELLTTAVSEQRYRARLIGVIAALAGIFSVMGIYGVTSRSVARRTREIGIRLALGAARSRVHAIVTLQAMRLAVFGVMLGLAGAAALGGVFDGFLWGVSRYDPVTMIVVAVGLPLTAAIAALQPARRATRVDPIVALREE